jgi:ribosomal protein S11
MSTLKLMQFSGEIPRLLPRLLPDTGSQFAENVRLDDGGLTPVRGLRFEHAFDPSDDHATIYKFGETWLSWATAVNAAPGPVATDRLYYTGDGVPKMRVGTDVYNLKVQYPTAALTATVGGTNEVQQIVVSATGGTFTVTFDGSTTTALAYNISAASLQAALEALDNIEPGDVTVTGGPGATAALVITFGGRYAYENVDEVTTNSASLTGGSSTATVSTTTQGSGSGDVYHAPVRLYLRDRVRRRVRALPSEQRDRVAGRADRHPVRVRHGN